MPGPVAETLLDWVCRELAHRADLSPEQAQDAVGLALREAGLEPPTVDVQQMRVTLQRVMPALLERQGVPQAGPLCTELAHALWDSFSQTDVRRGESAYDVFRRLGGD